MELASTLTVFMPTPAAYLVSWILRSRRSTGTFLPRNVLRWELWFLCSRLGSKGVRNVEQKREGTVEALLKTFTVSLAPVTWFGLKYHMKQRKTWNLQQQVVS